MHVVRDLTAHPRAAARADVAPSWRRALVAMGFEPFAVIAEDASGLTRLVEALLSPDGRVAAAPWVVGTRTGVVFSSLLSDGSLVETEESRVVGPVRATVVAGFPGAGWSLLRRRKSSARSLYRQHLAHLREKVGRQGAEAVPFTAPRDYVALVEHRADLARTHGLMSLFAAWLPGPILTFVYIMWAKVQLEAGVLPLASWAEAGVPRVLAATAPILGLLIVMTIVPWLVAQIPMRRAPSPATTVGGRW